MPQSFHIFLNLLYTIIFGKEFLETNKAVINLHVTVKICLSTIKLWLDESPCLLTKIQIEKGHVNLSMDGIVKKVRALDCRNRRLETFHV